MERRTVMADFPARFAALGIAVLTCSAPGAAIAEEGEAVPCTIGFYDFGVTRNTATIDFGRPTQCEITKKPQTKATECHLVKVERRGLVWKFLGQFDHKDGTSNENNCQAKCVQALKSCPAEKTANDAETLKGYDHKTMKL